MCNNLGIRSKAVDEEMEAHVGEHGLEASPLRFSDITRRAFKAEISVVVLLRHIAKGQAYRRNETKIKNLMGT